MTFDEEIAAGFAELAQEAGTGTALSFGGVPIVGVFGNDAGPDPLKVDTKMGSIRRLVLEVSRAEIAKLPKAPKVGLSFAYGPKTLRIEDLEDDDPTAPSIVYTVKVSSS